MVNLILGEELLPYSVLCTTSTICELRYGDQRRIVAHFRDKDPETGLPIKEVPLKAATSEQSYLEQISPYVQVKSDREKGSLYKKVELFWPHQLLKVLISDVTLNKSYLISYKSKTKYVKDGTRQTGSMAPLCSSYLSKHPISNLILNLK